MTFKCPCCGADIAARAPVEALPYLRANPIAKRALEALVAAYPRTMSNRMLCDIVWADDPNGGPGDPDNVLSVSICYANKKMKATGWRIGAPSRGSKGQIGLMVIQ